ncbi:MAG: AI-2E family transporter [Gammaproteobacteria bacterium]
MEFVKSWFTRHFSDPQVIGLAVVVIFAVVLIVLAGHMLAPAIAALVIAYLLEGPIQILERYRLRRLLAVGIVFSGFMTFLLFLLVGVLPLISRQATQLIQDLPGMVQRGQEALLALPQRYPDLFSEAQVRELISQIRAEVLSFGQRALSESLSSVLGFMTILVYLILVPLMVFFFMKDKRRISTWFTAFLPDERRLVRQVWRDVDSQIGNYVRGKIIEILIVWGVTYVTFTLMSLRFALLLGMLVGLSVLIPYIGAVAVTFPVALIAYFQWGFSPEFAWLLGAYAVIQALDGNVLVPVLFSEVVNLHPVAIIVSILVFGGIWGFWGVFFAIPLATVVQALLKAWPTLPDEAAGHLADTEPGG